MTRIEKDSYYLQVAQVVSARSTCLRRQYGAVIVKDDEVIAGYNGSARGKTIVAIREFVTVLRITFPTVSSMKNACRFTPNRTP